MTLKGTRAAFIVFFVILVVAFLYMASPLMMPAFVAAIVATIFHPLYARMEALFRRKRYAAAAASTFVCFAIVLIPLALVAVGLSVRIVQFSVHLVQQIQAGDVGFFLDKAGTAINAWISSIPGGQELVLDLRVATLEAVKAVAGFIYQYSPKVLSSTASIAINLVLIAIFLTVFFAEGSRLFAWIVRLMPLSAVHKEEISREMRVMVSALLLGMIGTALIQGLLIGAGFWAAGFSNAVMWGMIAVTAAFIPIVGAASCYIGATVALAVMGRWEAAVLFLIYGVLIVSSVDNVLRPLVMRGRIKVHPLLLFVALLGGVRAFGPIGALFGPVLLAVFMASLRIYQREFSDS